jgi:hypothetical protein
MRPKFVLPLPRFVLHPLTAAAIAVIHGYLAYGHITKLVTGPVEWEHIWKGFGALFGAYVFAALASRRVPARMEDAFIGATRGIDSSRRTIGL